MFLEQLSIRELTVERIIGGGITNIPGKIFYLDPTNGSDGNDGLAPNTAKASLAAAYALMTANQHDTLVYIAGTTGLNVASGGFDWNLAQTHLVGICANTMYGKRARIQATSTNTDAVMFTISARGCNFKNIRWFYGVASAAALGCVKITGSDNAFDDCSFEGIGNATQDAANAYSLEINGAADCTFTRCNIGSDTIDRGTASNDELRFDTRASKALFDDCIFHARIEATTHNFVKVVDVTGIGSYILFRNCIFVSHSTANAYTMASVFDVPASVLTAIIGVVNCGAIGCTDWESNNRGTVYTAMPDAGTAGTGCGIGQVV